MDAPAILQAAPPGEAAAPAERDSNVRLEQLRLAYAYLPQSQGVALLLGLVLAAVQWHVSDPIAVVVWVACLAAVTLGRIFLRLAFVRAAANPIAAARWRGLFLIAAGAAGVVWGAAVLALYPEGRIDHQVFLAFVLGGVVAGSVTTLTPVYPAFLLFATLAVVPLVVRLFAGGDLIHSAMGWMAVVFYLSVAVTGWRNHRLLAEALAFRFDNYALIEHLMISRDRADALNRELRSVQQALEKSNEALERRVAERTAELTRINTELERFAYVASHDMQEPLRNAANFALLLTQRYRDRLDGDGREFLQYILSSVKQMRELVDSLLFHSRLGAPPGFAPTDCDRVVEKVLSDFRSAISEGGAVVTRDALPVVEADAMLLEQVFRNLLANALKFRGENAPRVHIGVEARGAEWVFSVRDNGIGFAPRYAGLVFEMFERLHGQERYPGTGMGLAICKRIVEAHHGRIWADSAEGRGATISFSLPRGGGADAQHRSNESPRDPAGGG